MLDAREIYKTFRWRLVPVRYAGKVRRSLQRRPSVVRSAQSDEVRRKGFAPGPRLGSAEVDAIRAIYAPRSEAVAPSDGGHPFVNLFWPEDIDPANPLFRFALSPAVLDAAHDYFGGHLVVDSIQYLYSWPTSGAMRESQKWHRDYGDSTSFHCIVYANDVLTAEDGPFVFVDREDASRIGKSLFIRRIDDDQFFRELGDGKLQTFYGKAGDSVLVDPAACYHYGSRCKHPRHAIFVTFSTDRPYVGPVPTIAENAEKAVTAARVVRPDLSEGYLRAIFSA